MSKFKTEQVAGMKDIRKFDHTVSIPYKVSESTAGMKVLNGEKTIPAGTILPANDATAIGVVLSDTVVEYGAVAAPLVVHGFLDGTKLPAQPTAEAMSALKQIHFSDVTP